MKERLRIYKRVGIGFFILFIISMVVITIIQTENNLTDMLDVNKAANKMGEEIVNEVKSYETNKYSSEYLMWEVNGKINRFVGDSWNNHRIYSSVQLLDSNRQVISRTGYMLQIAPLTGNENHYNIPLSSFCSDEQLNIIYSTFRKHIQGEVISVRGEINGYIDKLGQWVPNRIVLHSKEDESKSVELSFNEDSDEYSEFAFENAFIWIVGPGSNKSRITNRDRKLLNECDVLALSSIEKSQVNQLGVGGMNDFTYMEFSGTGIIEIDDETYYYAIGIKGFPLYSAIKELIPLYFLLLLVISIVYYIVSRGFIKQYDCQVAQELERRKLMIDAASLLKEPLEVIQSCGNELIKVNANEEREELLDTIILKTEQMDCIVHDLLTNVDYAEKGKKHAKK